MHVQVAALAGLLRDMKLDIFALKRQEGGLHALLQVRRTPPAPVSSSSSLAWHFPTSL